MPWHDARGGRRISGQLPISAEGVATGSLSRVAKGSDPALGERQKLRRGQGPQGEVRRREEIGSDPGYEINSRS